MAKSLKRLLLWVAVTVFLHADATSIGEQSTHQATIGTPPAVVNALNLSVVGHSVNATTHFWFPQSVVSFESGRTIVVTVQLEDDSPTCRFPECKHCHMLGPCLQKKVHATRISTDAGVSWSNAEDVLPPGFTVAFGGAMPSEYSYLKIGPPAPVDSLGSSFSAPGELLSLAPNGSFTAHATQGNITFSGFPKAIAPNITGLTRWCGIKQCADGTSVQVIQLELPDSSGGRSLTMVSTKDNYTFTYKGFIAAHQWPEFTAYSNGPCESSIVEVIVPGVSKPVLLVVFRVDSFANYYMSYSSNSGLNWSRPQQLPNSIGSVRPKMEVISLQGRHIVMLVGGRPGLALWTSTPIATNASSINWNWRETNLASTHNGLVEQQCMDTDFKYLDSWTNRTIFTNFSMHESTAYTHIVRQPFMSTDKSARFVLLYDRLAHGWYGPPGTILRDDYVFAMHFDISINSKN